ncbi:hypothetical protein [Azospirillum agricola]|uniref:hypothetical protein n=1 Tax=Azospirillum agricola TaxID=1720247 RepID=UPI001177BB9A|nr:hypothetical protein [Azospirillum agricola]
MKLYLGEFATFVLWYPQISTSKNGGHVSCAVTRYYLKAVIRQSLKDGTMVIARVKDMPTDAQAFGEGNIHKDERKMCGVRLYKLYRCE